MTHAVLRILLAACLMTALIGCRATGPIVVENDREFEGLAALYADLRPGQALNVLLVHGMLADEPQAPVELIDSIVTRLGLVKTVAGQEASRPVGVGALQRVRLGGELLWPDPASATNAAPMVRVEAYGTAASAPPTLNVFVVDYWPPLLQLKCRYIVIPDARVIGGTKEFEKCARIYPGIEARRLSSRPRLVNKVAKATLLEWGFADAVIASSGFREVLHEALLDSLGTLGTSLSAQQALALAQFAPNAIDSDAAALPLPPVAVITRSLGSYVLFDALKREPMRQPTLAALGADPAPVLCAARQVHMLANQMSLLTLTELETTSLRSEPHAAASRQVGLLRRGCPKNLADARLVAYHEPSDPLTLYASNPPGALEGDNSIINVVVPFARGALGLLADPVDAHTGQMRTRGIPELLMCGHRGDRSRSVSGADRRQRAQDICK